MPATNVACSLFYYAMSNSGTLQGIAKVEVLQRHATK